VACVVVVIIITIVNELIDIYEGPLYFLL